MPQNWCLTMCCLGNTDVRNAGEISGKWNRYLSMNSKSSKHRKKYTLFFLLLNWISILDFYSTWMKRLVFSQFQVNTISGYNAIHLRLSSSSHLPKWHQRAGALISDLSIETRHLVLIWKLSTLLPAVVYTVPSGSQLLLFFSAKSAFESGTITPATTKMSCPLEWKTPSCQPAPSSLLAHLWAFLKIRKNQAAPSYYSRSKGNLERLPKTISGFKTIAMSTDTRNCP